MRRSIVCASAVVGLGLVLLGALGSGGQPVALAALPPVVTAPFYIALDCDLTSPGIQDNCTLAPGVTRADVGVVFFNNTTAPYTIGAVGMRVIQSTTIPPFDVNRFTQLAGAASPSVDINPDFNQQDLPGGWSCVPSFSIFPFTGGADLTCSDANGIGNVITANSSVTVATVHYDLSTGVLAPPQPVAFYGFFRVGGPANTNPKFCSSGQFCPAYSAIINVPATGVAVVLDCDVAAPGIQSSCTSAPGTPAVDVGVVLVNTNASAIQLGSFNFNVEDPDQGRLNPPAIAGPFADRNPDLNQAQLSGTLACVSAEANSLIHRAGVAPGTVTSFLSCYDSGAGTTVGAGGQLTLATVHYLVPTTASPGAVPLALAEVEVADPQTITIIGCTYPCGGATITIVSAPAHVPSPTPTPSPTATAIASATPIVISQPPVSTPTTDMYFAIDCDLTHPGVQSDCTYRLGDASEIDVGVVLVNNGPPPSFPLASFGFLLHMPDRARLAPLPSLSLMDGNPDFNDTGVAGDWLCDRAESDSGIDGPAAAASYLACIEPADPGNGPRPATGSQLLLGTVRYRVGASARPGSIPLRVDNVFAADFTTLTLAECNDRSTVTQPCLPATLHLVAFPTVAKVPAGVGANVNPGVPAANLWICQVGACGGPGEGDLVVTERVTGVLTGDQNGDSLPDGLGAYEFQVEFDPLVIQSVNPSDVVFSPGGAGASRGPANCSMSIASENLVRFGCVTSGQVQGPEGGFDLARLDLVPAADDAKDLFPGNDNGMPTLIKDNQCELSDVFGHPVQGTVGGAGLLPACGDLSVTVRILEGDLNLDCRVDVADEALIAGHYGATFGSAFYDRWFDVEPRFHDLDVDIKDLQKVFGRDGSTCQAPVPTQPPVVPPFALAG